MKVMVAGATGAVGKPLIQALLGYGQDTYGITHSAERAQALASTGAKPLVLDVLDREAVRSAIESVRPDAIIDMLTSLPKTYTPEAMRQAAEADAKLRSTGGAYLRSAAEEFGVRRYIVQSTAFWYAPGTGLAVESDGFAFDATPGIAAGTRLYAEIEKSVLQSTRIEGVALRFGFFYGPGTWFHANGDMGEQVRYGRYPIMGNGRGVWSFIHVEDAGAAAAQAVYIRPGAYNIVNNLPAMQSEWLPGFARYLGAPFPPTISEIEATNRFGADAVYYATRLRGASNAKAKAEWNFEPRTFEWLL